MNDIQDVLVENDIKVDYSAGSPEAEVRRMEDSPVFSPEVARYEPAHRPQSTHAHRPSIFASVGQSVGQEGRVDRPTITSGPGDHLAPPPSSPSLLSLHHFQVRRRWR